MNSNSCRNKVSASFSMSSMTDMIFILLIFFIIMTTLVDPNKRNALKVNLPKSTRQKTEKPEITRIYITKELAFFVDNVPVDITEMEQLLHDKLMNVDRPRSSLHADRDVPYENIVSVMTIARDNQYELVLATKFK